MRPLDPAVTAPPLPRAVRAPRPQAHTLADRVEVVPRCAACGREPAEAFAVRADPLRPEAHERWSLRWCEPCQLGAIWPRPTPSQVASFYEVDDYYTHGRDAGWRAPRRTFFDRVRTHLAWRADRGEELDLGQLRARFATPRPLLCEVGCGNGSELAAFAKLGFETVGVEPDETARRASRERGLSVLAGTLEDLPSELPTGTFDLVVVSHVLEHTLDVSRSIENVRSLLGPDGLALVEVPNHACLGFHRAGPSWAFTDAPRHLNFFTPKSLADAFERRGFAVVESAFRGYCRQFSGEWLATERRNRCVHAPGDRRTGRLAASLEGWKLLARTWNAAPEKKYDSIRLLLRADRGS